MKFDDYYYETKPVNTSNTNVRSIYISENTFNNLCKLFNKDYKYIIECEDYKNDYGYGFKFTLTNSENFIILNRWKDEVENKDSMIKISESAYNLIKDEFNLDKYKII